MRPTDRTRRPIFESLERRELFSTVEQYNLLALLGYNHLGATWNYGLSGTGSIDGQSNPVYGSGKVTVGKKTVTYDKHASDVVKFVGGGLAATTAWYNNKQGTFETLAVINALLSGTSSHLIITVNLHNTKVAPPKMVLGQTYKNTGTYTGTFSAPIAGQTATGNFSGNASVSSALLTHQTVKVKAGTFNAIKGVYTLNITGTMMVKSGSQSAPVSFKLAESETFWAFPGVGIVKDTAKAELDLTFPGQMTHVAKSQITANLVSDILP